MADWSDVILEGIKLVLAPAVVGVIVAYGTYRGARTQLDARLVEIREQNTFNARRELFGLYKERRAKFEEQYFQHGEWLGRTLGQVSAGVDDETLLSMHHEVIKLATGQLPRILRQTQAEMARHQLTDTEPYRQLDGYITNSGQLVAEQSSTPSALRNNILAISEVLMCLEACQSLIWDAEVRRIFDPYIES
jgi:hypothetical protein